MGDLTPKEIAIAVPNITSRRALASETHRGHHPNTSTIPNHVSATVAAHARNGMMAVGMNELTSAVYRMKFAKCFRSNVLSHNPKRAAAAERNAVPSAMRV